MENELLLGNAFSLNMLAEKNARIAVSELSVARASEFAAEARSVVGHPDTAAVFTTELGVEVPANRESVVLNKGDVLIVGQYTGPRLPEGATELPEGAEITWLLVGV